ncbi:MAG TPA: SIS domain-containing protein [Polyangia bacterium]
MSTPGFIKRCVGTYTQALAALPPDDIDAVVAVLLDAYDRGARIYIAGNGGSASLASHFACDLEKTASGPQPRTVRRRMRAVSLNDNMATFSAWANDEGYRYVFSEQLRSHAEPRDVLIAISASGNSPNIVTALEAAAELGVRTVALLGFDGGRGRELAEHSLHVPVHDYGVVEGVHGVLTHVITTTLLHALNERRRDAALAAGLAPTVAPPVGGLP